MVTRLMTVMSGSVVTSSGPKANKSTKRARGAEKENTAPKKVARAKARDASSTARAGAKSVTSGMLEGFAEEKSVCETTINCGVGVRCKLWLDDVLACINHVVSQVSRQGITSSGDDVKDLKTHLIRVAILFGLKGVIVLQTEKTSKTYRKWSALRPALSEHALWHLIQAGFFPGEEGGDWMSKQQVLL